MKALQADLGGAQSDIRRGAQQQLHDRREQHNHAGVECENAENPGRSTGIETCLFVAETPQPVEQRTNRLFQFERLWRRLHVKSHAYEQRIIEVTAQACKRLAQGRLLGAERVGGSRQASFAEQHIEHPKRVQVEVFSVLYRNSLHIRSSNSLAASLSLR